MGGYRLFLVFLSLRLLLFMFLCFFVSRFLPLCFLPLGFSKLEILFFCFLDLGSARFGWARTGLSWFCLFLSGSSKRVLSFRLRSSF